MTNINEPINSEQFSSNSIAITGEEVTLHDNSEAIDQELEWLDGYMYLDNDRLMYTLTDPLTAIASGNADQFKHPSLRSKSQKILKLINGCDFIIADHTVGEHCECGCSRGDVIYFALAFGELCFQVSLKPNNNRFTICNVQKIGRIESEEED